MTATALAQTLSPQTPVPSTPGTGGTPFLIPTLLPETGLFDDITGAGAGGIGLLALIALGLVGVIVGARKLRK